VRFGCTIVYTGPWLGWKCFLVKVFTTLWGIKKEAEADFACFGKIKAAMITLQLFGKQVGPLQPE
jgi:hypothetical protein